MLNTVFSQNFKNIKPLILLVDDDEDERQLHRFHLETNGYRVTEMTSGAEVLALVKDLLFEPSNDKVEITEWPNLIIMDGLMPGLNGFETCRRLRALEQVFEARSRNALSETSPRSYAGYTQILIVSSLSDNDSVREALKAGANEYITKPVFWPLLNHRIQQILEIQKGQQHLQEQSDFINSLLQQSAVATVVIDTGHKVIFWNRAAEELTGVKASTVLGTDNHWSAFYPQKRATLGDILIDEDYASLATYYSNLGTSSVLAPKALQAEQWFQNMNGQDRYILFNAGPIHNSAGEMVAAITTLQDLTQRKLSEDALYESEVRFRGAMEGSLDAIFILKPVRDPETENIIDLIFIDVNSFAEKLLSRTKAELLGQRLFDFFSPGAEDGIFEKYVRAIKTGRTFESESKIITPGLNASWLKIQAVPLAGERGLAVICRDITQTKKIEETLTEQAHYDRLTGLPNRLHFEQHLEQYIAKTSSMTTSKMQVFAVGLIDLDGFKKVNDTLGHQAGDQLLIQVGQRIKEIVRLGDIVARLGGDEFTFILPGIQTAENAYLIGQKFLEVLSKDFTVEVNSAPQTVKIGASIGISLFPTDGQTSYNLIKEADQAMYQAKQAGKNRVKMVG